MTEISENMESAVTYAKIRHWIDNCEKNHKLCKSHTNGERKLPTRLAKISLQDHTVSILETTTLPLNTKYAALSYCWGESIFRDYLKKYYSTFTSTINFNQLPQTFLDAIRAASGIGLEYIWIDCLCILQDSTE